MVMFYFCQFLTPLAVDAGQTVWPTASSCTNTCGTLTFMKHVVHKKITSQEMAKIGIDQLYEHFKASSNFKWKLALAITAPSDFSYPPGLIYGGLKENVQPFYFLYPSVVEPLYFAGAIAGAVIFRAAPVATKV